MASPFLVLLLKEYEEIFCATLAIVAVLYNVYFHWMFAAE
jgi:hypothetical protein